MIKRFLRQGIVLGTLLVVISSLCLAVSATEVSVLDDQILISDTEGENSVSNGIVTIKAVGSSRSTTTNTITIKNNTTKKASILFDYSVEKQTAFTIGGVSCAASGSYSIELEPSGTLEIKLTSDKGYLSSKRTATLTLKNFSISTLVDSYVTVCFNSSLGSVSAGGTALSSGKPHLISAMTNFVATGDSFVAWVDADNAVIEKGKVYSVLAEGDKTVTALFATTPWFYVDGIAYDGIENAVAAAQKGTSKLIVLMNNSTLPAGNYTVPSGITLLVPFDENYTLYTTEPKTTGSGTLTTPSKYRTLTMATGANLSVMGALSISGKHCYTSPSTGNGSSPSGPVGFIDMKSGSNITVNNGGKLYVYGYITGSGSVTANNGADVYELFQIADFRGGTATTSGDLTDNKIFPLSQYYIQNIEVPATYNYGAELYCYTTIYMNKKPYSTTPLLIGTDRGLFRLNDGGSVTKDYLENLDRVQLECSGSSSLSNVTLTISYATVDSSSYVMPVTSNMSIKVMQGATVTVPEGKNMALLPGASVEIEAGGKLDVNANVYVYDKDQWGDYCGSNNAYFIPLKYAPGRTKTRTAADLVDASILVNGELDVSDGYLYTTASGANIYSTGYGIVKVKAGSETTTYQASQYVKDTLFGSTQAISPIAISITPAKLKHAKGDYLTTADATAATIYNYNVAHGYWYAGTHGETTATTPPTCTENGYTKHSCPCGYAKTDTEIAATGHSWGTWTYNKSTCTSTCAHDKKHTITVLLAYRMNSYIWLNATVSSTAGEQPVCSNTDIVYKQYLVKKVLSNELTSSIEVTFTLGGTTPTLDVGFLAYKNAIYGSASDETQTLLTAMENYGKAADVYFDTDGSGATGLGFGNLTCTNKQGVTVKPGTNAMGKQFDALNGYTVNGETYTVKSLGASFFFDECITLRMNYAMHYVTETETKFFDGILQGNDTIAQIGVLVGNTADYLKLTGAAELRADAGKYDEAYILYGPGTQGKDDNIPEVPGYTGSEEDEPIETVDFGALYVNFDLKSTEYAKQFALRPFIVINHGGKTADTSDDTYTVLYGEQYLYGLENYVYNICTNDDYDSVAKITAFRDFLVRTWDYALAADAKYN